MVKRFSAVPDGNPRRSLRRAALVAIALVVFTLLAALIGPSASFVEQAQPAVAAEPLDCPLPVNEGDTSIARRWIEHGELRLECTHIAGFPVFALPTARKVGLIP
jgi:hypothetical protein